MSFPLFHRPGTIVFLDDDPDYLEMLALVLPRQWHVKLFLRPHECINYLQQEPPFWEADAWTQQQLVEQWRGGKPLIPQILAYWSKYPERYALTRVRLRLFNARDGRPHSAGRTRRLARLARAAHGPGGRTGGRARVQPRPHRPVPRQADARYLPSADRVGGPS